MLIGKVVKAFCIVIIDDMTVKMISTSSSSNNSSIN